MDFECGPMRCDATLSFPVSSRAKPVDHNHNLVAPVPSFLSRVVAIQEKPDAIQSFTAQEQRVQVSVLF
jgi:hypothetical protein